MNAWTTDRALVAYMLVGAPALVWACEMLARRVTTWMRSPRRERIGTHRLAVNDAMRRHPAGSRVTPRMGRTLDREYARLQRHVQREIPAPAPAYGECNRCGAPVWVPSVHAQNCRVQPLRAGRWS